MTELEQQIDQSVGQDTEHARITFLKYVAMGRQLSGKTDAEVQALVRLACTDILAKVKAIMDEAQVAAQHVEKVDEKEVLAGLLSAYPESPAMLSVVTMIKTVDEKHTAIAKERDLKLAALSDALS